MAEVIYTNPQETSGFLEKAGFHIKQEQIIEVFPGYFPDRRIFRLANSGGETSRVIKIRPFNEPAQREIDNLKPLLPSYRFSGTYFGYLKTEKPEKSKFVAINMPYSGIDLVKLGSDLDMQDLGYAEDNQAYFAGFTAEQITHLIGELRSAQTSFAQRYGLIHGDVFQMKSPNNIVYHA